MSDKTYKKITEVEQLSFLNDDAKLFINQDNAIKQYSAKQLLNEHIPEVDKAHQMLTTNEEGEKIWEDKLCYDYRVNYEVYAETTIPEGKGGIMPSVDIIEPIVKNESYIVTWDGVEYPCLAYAREGSDFGTVLGNEYLAYTDQPELDNGLPFLFIGFFAHEMMKLVYAADKNGHVFSVKGSKQTNTVIPGQYIAGGIYAGTGSQSTIIGDPLTASAPGNGSISLGGVADGVASVAEGFGATHSDSQCAHAEGSFTHAHGWVSHVEGYANTAYRMQHVQGRRAVEDPNSIYADIVGNGSQDGSDRSNAYALDWYGNAYFDGDVFVQGDGKTLTFDGAKKVATEEYVDTKVAELVDNAPETLNTLKEVADALNENASTTEALNQAIGNKVDKTDYPATSNPNQILTTNENGEKVWENKLAYYTKEEKLLIPETTVEATSTWMLHTNFEAQTGDACRVILDGQTYTGSYYNANNGAMAVIRMTEGEGFPVKQFYVKFTNYSVSGPQLGFSGALTVYVTTTVVKPIKTEFLGIPVAQGLGIYSAKIGNLNRLTASGSASVALNESTSTGTSSCSVNNGISSGPSSFAQGTGEATNMGSSAFGIGTTSKSYAQFVNGKNNIEDSNNTYAMIVGNGQSGYDENDEYYVNHANAYTLDWSGNARFAGDVYAQGTDINNLQDAKKLATEEYVEEKLLDSDLVQATAFNELADTVKGLDKYCAFMKQGDQIKLGNVQEYSQMQEMLNGTNKFHATLAVSYVNEEGFLISETCYAKNVMSAIDMETGSKPYVNFSFETFNGETIKFRWNADNTISNVVTIAAIPAEEAEV